MVYALVPEKQHGTEYRALGTAFWGLLLHRNIRASSYTSRSCYGENLPAIVYNCTPAGDYGKDSVLHLMNGTKSVVQQCRDNLYR
eukprot:1198226-Rhodomonas_salina.1